MEIVINIPEGLKNDFESEQWTALSCMEMKDALMNGTPLPKGHGDLIDRNDLLKHYDSTTYHNGIEERKIHFVQIGYVNDAKPIIEADKEG